MAASRHFIVPQSRRPVAASVDHFAMRLGVVQSAFVGEQDWKPVLGQFRSDIGFGIVYFSRSKTEQELWL